MGRQRGSWDAHYLGREAWLKGLHSVCSNCTVFWGKAKLWREEQVQELREEVRLWEARDILGHQSCSVGYCNVGYRTVSTCQKLKMGAPPPHTHTGGGISNVSHGGWFIRMY